MVELEYRGWTIRETDSPWALKYGCKYEYSNDIEVYVCESIEVAKENIDERTDEPEDND